MKLILISWKKAKKDTAEFFILASIVVDVASAAFMTKIVDVSRLYDTKILKFHPILIN